MDQVVCPKIHPDTKRKMQTGELNGIGGGQFVPHFLLLRDSRVLPIAEDLWKKSGGDQDKYTELVFDHITRNIGYAFDEDIEGGLTEYVQMPFEALQRGWGDCDCSTEAMISLLSANGVPCHMTFGYAGVGSHRWPEVMYKGVWHVFDTTTGGVFPIDERIDRGYIDMFYVTPHSFRPSCFPIPLYLP